MYKLITPLQATLMPRVHASDDVRVVTASILRRSHRVRALQKATAPDAKQADVGRRSKRVLDNAVDLASDVDEIHAGSRFDGKEGMHVPEAAAILAERRASGMWVGAHVSMAGGLERAPVNAAAIGATAFALDLRSKRRWDCPPLLPETVAAFKAACVAYGYTPDHILPHGSYLINLGSPYPETLQRSREALLEELQRAEALGIANYNMHPGSSCGQMSEEACMDQIAAGVAAALAATSSVRIVLENTAGQGHSVGHTFEQLAYLLARIPAQLASRVGVCLDTCHLWAAGYDLSTPAACAATFDEFDRLVGRRRLVALHVNDSKTPRGLRRDRHENVGAGAIGAPAFRWIMGQARFAGMPLIMETPVQARGPAVHYRQSLAGGALHLRRRGGGGEGRWTEEEGTDQRDISLLYSYAAAVRTV